MKVFAKVLLVSIGAVMMAGCASNGVYVPAIPPHAQAKLLDYFEQPDNKVFIIAIDPSGDFAYGYEYGKASLKEAAKGAVVKCDASRESHNILARPYIYALNDRVVFEEMIRKAHEKDSAEKEREAQAKAVEQADAAAK